MPRRIGRSSGKVFILRIEEMDAGEFSDELIREVAAEVYGPNPSERKMNNVLDVVASVKAMLQREKPETSRSTICQEHPHR